VTGTSEVIVQTREFLRTIDIPTPQVVIDAVVVEYQRSTERDFGLEYGAGTGEKAGSGYTYPHLRYSRSGLDAKDLLDALKIGKTLVDKLPDDFWITLRL
jgi:type II secretory pathway component GspD/PulD (secretin)